jgi:LmbE family N-acetylglucosaminyl deacetylase
MNALGAVPHWLPLWDSQYIGNEVQDRSHVRQNIRAALEDLCPSSVVFPIGVHHSDHETVGDACCELIDRMDIEWYCYLDMPYAQEFPEEVDSRLAALTRGRPPAPALTTYPARDNLKPFIMNLYATQTPTIARTMLSTYRSMRDPERYWRIR